MAMNQPITWHGGKHYLAKWIVSLMPPHLHYVEPYFGGGSVLLAHDPNRNWMATNGEKLPVHLQGCSEVVNDINGELMNFWAILRSGEEWWELRDLLDLTPFSEDQFESVCNFAKDYQSGELPDILTNCLSRAWWFFICNRQSRQGIGKDFATLSRTRTRGGRNEQVNSWLSAIDGLAEIHERLKNVVIMNDEAVNVIKKEDGELTLFYCDPPYLHSTRGSTGEYGICEMTERDHENLLLCLSGIQGKFMLSGYRSSLYDAWAVGHQWFCYEKQIDNKASSAKTKEIKTECVWTNFKLG